MLALVLPLLSVFFQPAAPDSSFFSWSGRALDTPQWYAANPAWKEGDTLTARYFLYRFSKGIHRNELNLSISGFFPKNAEHRLFWRGRYLIAGGKLSYQAINPAGSVILGEAEQLTTTEIKLKYFLTDTTGKRSHYRDRHTFSENGLYSVSERREKKQWKPAQTLELKPMPAATGEITFTSTRDGHYDVYVMKADGSNQRNVTSSQGTDYWGAWIPGTDSLVFYSNRHGSEDLFQIAASGKGLRRITSEDKTERIPNVSPDGKHLVFVSNRDHKSGELYLIQRDGTGLRRLTQNDVMEDGAWFSPDGASLLFTRDTKNPADSTAPFNGEVFLMNLADGSERQLTTRPGWDGGPQFSPDGSQIAFYGKSEAGNYDLFLMNPDGSNIRNLTNDTLEDYSPDWSPDGKWLAFTKGSSKNYDIWIMYLETGLQFRLTDQPRRDESPFWKK
jgi:TolB protein